MQFCYFTDTFFTQVFTSKKLNETRHRVAAKKSQKEIVTRLFFNIGNVLKENVSYGAAKVNRLNI